VTFPLAQASVTAPSLAMLLSSVLKPLPPGLVVLLAVALVSLAAPLPASVRRPPLTEVCKSML